MRYAHRSKSAAIIYKRHRTIYNRPVFYFDLSGLAGSGQLFRFVPGLLVQPLVDLMQALDRFVFQKFWGAGT